MIFGKKQGQAADQHALLGTLLRLIMLAPLAWAPAWGAPAGGLEDLMQRLSQVRSVHARYREEIHASLLEHGITSTGTIRYRAPDRIVKSSDGDPAQEVRIEGDRIRFRKGDERQELDIGEHRAIEGLVSALRSVFAGDLRDLQRHFKVRFAAPDGDAGRRGWQLELEPRDAEVSWLFSQIAIRGNGREIRTIETREPNGDARTMRLEPISIDPPSE